MCYTVGVISRTHHSAQGVKVRISPISSYRVKVDDLTSGSSPLEMGILVHLDPRQSNPSARLFSLDSWYVVDQSISGEAMDLSSNGRVARFEFDCAVRTVSSEQSPASIDGSKPVSPPTATQSIISIIFPGESSK